MTYQEPEQNYTKIPNPILDAMGDMSESELKLTLCLVRYTFGYHTDRAQMTYDIMQERAKMSRGAVYRAIELVEERGFFRRGRKSFWFVNSSEFELCYVNDVGKSSDNELSQSANSSESERKYAGKSSNFEPTKIKEEKEKEEIYIHPVPEPIQELITAIAQTVKTGYGPKTESDFEAAAYMLFGWDVSPAKVKDFTGWWKENGYYSGRPALKSLSDEFRNYLDGVKIKQNGNGRSANNPTRPQPAPASERVGGAF